MNITNQLLKRKIYNQSGTFSWAAELDLDDCNYFNFGFSGDGGVLNWEVSGGKVYSDGLFLHSFDLSLPISMSGDVSKSANDLFIDGSFVYIGKEKVSNNYSYIYFDCSGECDVSFFLDGAIPSGFDASGSGSVYNVFESYLDSQPIYASLQNINQFPVNIFTGNIDHSNFSFADSQFPRVISPGDTENFEILFENFISSEQSLPLSFETDFGNFSYDLVVSGVAVSDSLYYLYLGPEQPLIYPGEVNRYNSYFYNSSGSNISVTLEYISGVTGQVFYESLESKYLTGIDVSGYITGSGNLCSAVTGLVSGYDSLLDIYSTGIGSGQICFNNYIATGSFESGYLLTFCVPGSGLVAHVYTGSGYAEITASGYITQTNKTLSFNGVSGYVTGYDSFGNIVTGYTELGSGSIAYTGAGIESAVLTGDFDASEYETVSFSYGPIFATGNYSRYVAISGIAMATGERIWGTLKGPFAQFYEPGLWTFYKTYSGIGTGEAYLNLDSFNPTEGSFDEDGLVEVSGLISRSIATGQVIDYCEFELPEFPLVGIPDQYAEVESERIIDSFIRVTDSGLVPINSIEYYVNNSYFLSQYPTFVGSYQTPSGAIQIGGNTPSGGRVRISRLGQTSSGSGYFLDPIRSLEASTLYANKPYELGWGETLTNGQLVNVPSSGNYDSFKIAGNLFFGNDYDDYLFKFNLKNLTGTCSYGNNLSLNLNIPSNKTVQVDLYKSGFTCLNRATSPNLSRFFTSSSVPVGLYGFNNIITGSDSSGNSLELPDFATTTYYSCVGNGCTGIGFYTGFCSGIYGCNDNDDLFAFGFSGQVDSLFDLSSGRGAVYSAERGVSGDYSEAVFPYAYAAQMSDGIPYKIKSSASDYVCFGPGCSGLGEYRASFNYSETGKNECTTVYHTVSVSGNCTSRIEDNILVRLNGTATVSDFSQIVLDSFEGAFNCERGDEEVSISCLTKLYEFENGFGRFSGSLYTDENGLGSYKGISGYDVQKDYIQWGVVGPGAFPTGLGEYSGYIFIDGTGIYDWGEGGYTGQPIDLKEQAGQDQSWAIDQILFYEGVVRQDQRKRGIGSGAFNTYNCISYSGDSKHVTTDFMVNSSNFSLSLPGGSYDLKLSIVKDWVEPVNVVIPEPSLIQFTHPVFTGCEEDRAIWLSIERSGYLNYEYSGNISVKRPVDMDHLESSEILTGGLQAYDTLLPITMPRYAQTVYIRVPLEDEGDWEDDEGVDLQINSVSSNPLIVTENARLQTRLLIKDDDNPNATPCTPTLEPSFFDNCSELLGDCSGYCICASFNYPPGYDPNGGGGGGAGGGPRIIIYPINIPQVRIPRWGLGGGSGGYSNDRTPRPPCKNKFSTFFKGWSVSPNSQDPESENNKRSGVRVDSYWEYSVDLCCGTMTSYMAMFDEILTHGQGATTITYWNKPGLTYKTDHESLIFPYEGELWVGGCIAARFYNSLPCPDNWSQKCGSIEKINVWATPVC